MASGRGEDSRRDPSIVPECARREDIESSAPGEASEYGRHRQQRGFATGRLEVSQLTYRHSDSQISTGKGLISTGRVSFIRRPIEL
jgi:hypothetical protein